MNTLAYKMSKKSRRIMSGPKIVYKLEADYYSGTGALVHRETKLMTKKQYTRALTALYVPDPDQRMAIAAVAPDHGQDEESSSSDDDDLFSPGELFKYLGVTKHKPPKIIEGETPAIARLVPNGEEEEQEE
jgi:hypothetical protein